MEGKSVRASGQPPKILRDRKPSLPARMFLLVGQFLSGSHIYTDRIYTDDRKPFLWARRFLLLSLVLALCSCGGGGSGEGEKLVKVCGFIEGEVRERVVIRVSGTRNLETQSETSGFYSFSLPNGTYTLSASMAKYLPIPQSRQLIIRGKDSLNNNFLLVKDLRALILWADRAKIRISSTPAIDHRGLIYVGSSDGSLYAFLSNGDCQWSYATQGAIRSSPAIDQRGTIYVGSDDHCLYAISSDGKRQWVYQTSAEVQSSPAIDDFGRIYVGSNDGHIYALSPQGGLLWSYQTGGAIQSSPAIDAHGTIYVGSSDGYLYALSAQGSLKWKFPTSGAIIASAAIGADNTIYIGSFDHRLYAITSSGEKKWAFTTYGQIRSSCALAEDGTIYFGSDDQCLYALTSDGKKKWVYQATSSISSSPAIDQAQIIYFSSDDGTLYALTSQGTIYGLWPAANGESRSAEGIFAQQGIACSPSLAAAGAGEMEGRIYVSGPDHSLYALASPSSKGWLSSSIWPMFRQESRHRGSIPLDLRCSLSGRISGVVTEGVTLSLQRIDEYLPITLKTASDGTFRFIDLRPGIYLLKPYKEDYCFTPESIELSIFTLQNEGNNFVSSLPKTYTICGRISGDVQAGVVLYLDGNNSQGKKVKGITISKANGDFEFTVYWGSYQITPALAGYSFQPTSRQIKVESASHYVGNNFVARALSPQERYMVSGSITGDTLSQVTLTLSGDLSQTAVSDTQGRFSFWLPNGRYTISPSKPGYTFSPPQREIIVQGSGSAGNDFFAACILPPVSGEKWSVKVGGRIYSSLALGSDGTIYAGSYDDGKIYAISPNGSINWTLATQGAVFAAPVIDPKDGTIYIGSTDHYFYAIDPGGKIKWKIALGDKIMSTAALGSDGTLYVGCNDGFLYALRGADGAKKWASQLENIVSSPALGSDGAIYVGAGKWEGGGHLYALRVADGGKKWVADIYTLSRPAIGADGTLYVGSKDKNIYALYSTNGAPKWYYPTGGEIVSSPVIGPDGTIYVGSDDGRLYALTPEGRCRWSAITEAEVRSSAAVGTDGTVYIGSHDYYLYAFDPVSGEQKWRFLTEGGKITAIPVIGKDGTIYVGSQNGRIYALGGQ